MFLNRPRDCADRGMTGCRSARRAPNRVSAIDETPEAGGQGSGLAIPADLGEADVTASASVGGIEAPAAVQMVWTRPPSQHVVSWTAVEVHVSPGWCAGDHVTGQKAGEDRQVVVAGTTVS